VVPSTDMIPALPIPFTQPCLTQSKSVYVATAELAGYVPRRGPSAEESQLLFGSAREVQTERFPRPTGRNR
jgi:hypothetical protein